MLAKILVHSDIEVRKQEINKIIHNSEFIIHTSDQLYLDETEKLGVEAAKKIREHLSTKAFQSKAKAVVVVNADDFTTEAQNSLLKTLEEPPEEALIILAISNEDKLLPTVISRCELINLHSTTPGISAQTKDYSTDIEKILASNIEENFSFIEKLEDKEGFLNVLIGYLHLHPRGANDLELLEDLINVQRWQNSNINTRAVLEYLILRLAKS